MTYRVLHGPYGAGAKGAIGLLAALPAHPAFTPPEIIQVCGSPGFVTPTPKRASPYRGGHAREMAEFLYFLRRHGCTLADVRRGDFLVADGRLQFVGYGVNLVPYTPEAGKAALDAAYAALGDDRPPRDEFGQVTLKS